MSEVQSLPMSSASAPAATRPIDPSLDQGRVRAGASWRLPPVTPVHDAETADSGRVRVGASWRLLG